LMLHYVQPTLAPPFPIRKAMKVLRGQLFEVLILLVMVIIAIIAKAYLGIVASRERWS
jgi:uncharacterized protein (UPF0333 family)